MTQIKIKWANKMIIWMIRTFKQHRTILQVMECLHLWRTTTWTLSEMLRISTFSTNHQLKIHEINFTGIQPIIKTSPLVIGTKYSNALGHPRPTSTSSIEWIESVLFFKHHFRTNNQMTFRNFRKAPKVHICNIRVNKTQHLIIWCLVTILMTKKNSSPIPTW